MDSFRGFHDVQAEKFNAKPQLHLHHDFSEAGTWQPCLCVFTPAVVLPFPSQMGGASSYSTQFLSHSGPRGPPPGMVSSRPGPPPTTGGLYPSHPAQAQKMPQHAGYPGGPQGLKRPFHSEVSGVSLMLTHNGNLPFLPHMLHA